MTVTAAKNIRRQLDKIHEELDKNETVTEDAQNAIEDFERKFGKLEEEVVPKGIGLRSSREESLRGGAIAQRISSLVANLGGFPFPPTSTDRLQLKELEKVLDTYVTQMNGIIEEDIPALNVALEANGMKPVKKPKKVELEL